MVDQKQIRTLLEKHFNWTGTVSIDEQGQISVAGYVEYETKTLSRWPPEIEFLHVGGNFYCNNNPQLQSLLGSPQSVGRNFDCSDNPMLTSLEGLPREIPGRLLLTYSPQLPLLRALVAKMGVGFWSGNRLQTGDAEKVAEIINRYAGEGRRAMFKCKKELIEAGFSENARW
jgi:hypothetical protein